MRISWKNVGPISYILSLYYAEMVCLFYFYEQIILDCWIFGVEIFLVFLSTETLIWLTVHGLSPRCWQMFFNFHFVVCGVAWLHHEYEYHPIWLILLQIWKDNFLKMVASRYLLSPTACVNLHWPILHTSLLACLYIINNEILKPVGPTTSMTSPVFWSTLAPCYEVTF